MNWFSRLLIVFIILQCQFPCSVRPTAIITTVTTTIHYDSIVTTTMTLTTITTIATSILATGKSGKLYRVTLPSDVSVSTNGNYCTK